MDNVKICDTIHTFGDAFCPGRYELVEQPPSPNPDVGSWDNGVTISNISIERYAHSGSITQQVYKHKDMITKNQAQPSHIKIHL